MKREKVKRKFLRGLAFALMLSLSFVLTSCALPTQLFLKPKGKIVQEKKLYDRHNDFVNRVKNNLGIPSVSDATYIMEDPSYQEEFDAETVYIQFVENGETVAAAECYTENGDVARSVMMYTPVRKVEKETAKNKTSDGKQEVQYRVYTNARYGFSVPYPDFLIPQPEADNGDGRVFISQDGMVTMTAWGSHTPSVIQENPTLDTYYDFIISDLDYEPTYKTKGENFFVFSGYKGNNIVYQRHTLKSDGTENVLILEYPIEQKKRFNDITTYVSMNMKTGVGVDSVVAK